MKRCPECGREYDNTMAFCLDDGSELLYGPASMDEPATAILSVGGTEAEPPGDLRELPERRSLSAHRAAEPQDGRSAYRAAELLEHRGAESQEYRAAEPQEHRAAEQEKYRATIGRFDKRLILAPLIMAAIV